MNFKNIVIVALFFISILFSFSCQTIKYLDDLGFSVSAMANSPEWPVYINGKFCRDIDGIMGLCSKRVKSNESVSIKFEKQSYDYRVHLQCSKDTGIDFSVDVPKINLLPYEYVIKPEQFSTLRSFTCIGEIFPGDRTEPTSAKFEIRIMVVDASYAVREIMNLYKYKGKDYLLLGQHAKYSIVYDHKNGKEIRRTYKQETMVQIDDPSNVRALSESFSMRFNSYGN